MPQIGPDDAALHPGQVGLASPLLFTGLVDDAAMFPPGNAPLDRALAEHLDHRTAWYAGLLGPLLVPATRAEDLAAAVAELVAAQTLSQPFAVGVIGPGGAGAETAVAAVDRAVDILSGVDGLELTGVELPLRSTSDPAGDWARLGAGPRGTGERAVWWEVERGPSVRDDLDRLAAAVGSKAVGSTTGGTKAGGAKLRTGGVEPAAVPSELEVATFLRHAIDVDLTFKLTAGLHHAVRSTDPATGLEQHGVLNVLCAIKAALNGAEEDELADVLAQRDPAPLVERTNGMSDTDASVARAFWSSFGCCGVTDPIDELARLGLLSGRVAAGR